MQGKWSIATFILSLTSSTGKTIQVISFLSAIMLKTGDGTDKHRRRQRVSRLQDGKTWKRDKLLPPANKKWPTCLIVAPSTVVHNWKREFKTVCSLTLSSALIPKTYLQWSYLEVGVYTGPSQQRVPVLKDFKLGRFDVGQYDARSGSLTTDRNRSAHKLRHRSWGYRDPRQPRLELHHRRRSAPRQKPWCQSYPSIS